MVQIAIKTIGCRLNQAESQDLSAAFGRAGFAVVGERAQADVLLVNTCAVTHQAVRKSRQALRAYHHRWPRAKIVVIGCSVPELACLPEVAIAIPLRDKTRAVEIISRKLKIRKAKEKAVKKQLFRSRTRVLVKIQDGCDEDCAYCIVPHRRGRPRSVPAAEILKKIKGLDQAGTKEIILTGVHLGRYASAGMDLAGLVSRILVQTAIPRIRFSSIEPQHFTTKILQLYESPRICPFLHLPIQCGSDRVLRLMGRRYRSGQITRLLGLIRKNVPGIFLSTDIIVGFPGESEIDFRRSVAFCRRAGFAKIHVFSYSRREGTPASRYPGQLDPAIIARRSRELRRVSDQLNYNYRRRYAGKSLELLLETPRSGTSREGLRVSIAASPRPIDALAKARIISVTKRQTWAELLYLWPVDPRR